MSDRPLVARVPHGYGRPDTPTQTVEGALAAAAIELRKQLLEGGIPQNTVDAMVQDWWAAKVEQK